MSPQGEFPKPNIVQVLEFYGGRVLGPDRGGWRKATCPIHDDTNPSASVNEDDCRFRCFVCDLSGDAVDLIGAMENVGQSESVARAKELFGDGDSQVRSGRGGSSLLPGGKGHRQGRRNFRAPWTRF